MSNHPENRDLEILTSYIAVESSMNRVLEDSERGLNIPYDVQLNDEVFSWLAGGRSLASYCNQEGKPARSLIYQWLKDSDKQYDGLREKFNEGLRCQADAFIDEAIDVASEPLMFTKAGMLDGAMAADKKNRFEARLRLAAILNPLKYSPLVKTAVQAEINQNVNVTQNNKIELTDAQLLQVLAALERKKNADVASSIGLGHKQLGESKG